MVSSLKSQNSFAHSFGVLSSLLNHIAFAQKNPVCIQILSSLNKQTTTTTPPKKNHKTQNTVRADMSGGYYVKCVVNDYDRLMNISGTSIKNL